MNAHPSIKISQKIKDMDLGDLKLKTLGINAERFGRIFSFVDYGNVNYWYEKDQRDAEGNTLKTGQKLIVDIEKLANFTGLFSKQKRFYYGWNPNYQRKRNYAPHGA